MERHLDTKKYSQFRRCNIIFGNKLRGVTELFTGWWSDTPRSRPVMSSDTPISCDSRGGGGASKDDEKLPSATTAEPTGTGGTDSDGDTGVDSNTSTGTHSPSQRAPRRPSQPSSPSKSRTTIATVRQQQAELRELFEKYRPRPRTPPVEQAEPSSQSTHTDGTAHTDGSAPSWFGTLPSLPSLPSVDVSALTSSASTVLWSAVDAASSALSSGLEVLKMTGEQFVTFIQARLAEPVELQELRKVLAGHDLAEFAPALYRAPHNITRQGMASLLTEAQVRDLSNAMGWTLVQRMNFLRACQKCNGSAMFFGVSIQDCEHCTQVPGFARPIPDILVEYSRFLRRTEDGLRTKALFRLSPDYSLLAIIEALTESNCFNFEGLGGLVGEGFDFFGDPGNREQLLHVVASCFKKYLRSMPSRLLEPVPIGPDSAPPTPTAALEIVHAHLDEDGRAVLLWLLRFLSDVVAAQSTLPSPDSGSEQKAVGIDALAVIFAAALFPDFDLVGMTLEVGIGEVQDAVKRSSDARVAFVAALLRATPGTSDTQTTEPAASHE